MRVTCASIEITEHLLSPTVWLFYCQFHTSIIGRCSTTVDIITALTTINRQSKLQINMQVVTCEKMKTSGGLSLVPTGAGTRLMWVNV